MSGGIAEQTHQVLKNLRAVLKAAGSDLDRAVKTTVFLKSMDNFVAMNEVYGRPEYFGADPPARSTVEVARLPRDVLVEIEVVALGLRLIGAVDPDRLAGRPRHAAACSALLVVHVLVALVLIIPTWRICTRAGYSGALSLFHLVPLIGSFIVMAVLAFGDWPNGEASRRAALTMGLEYRGPAGPLGLGSAFALVGVVLAGWMAWRIVDKAGLPGWAGPGRDPADADRHRLDRAADPALGLRLHALAARRAPQCRSASRPARRQPRPGAPRRAAGRLCRRRPWRWPTGGGSDAHRRRRGARHRRQLGAAYLLTGAAVGGARRACRCPTRRSASRMPAC